MTSPRPFRRMVLGVALAAASLPAATTFATVTATPAAAAQVIELDGYGWGHGRGLGQYGSLGYAIDHGWNHSQILAHFYGNTTMGHLPDGRGVSVRLLNRDGLPLTAMVAQGNMSTTPGGTAPDRAVRIAPVSGGLQIYDGPGCNGPWTPRGGPHATAQMSVLPPPGAADRNGFLQNCEFHAGGAFAGVRWYRGTLRLANTEFGLRTINDVLMEEYLKGVVPRESPASWADLGGGKGAHALRAQAVAARSYAAAEGRYDYAHTCDTISCQVYGGHAHQPAGGSFNLLEDHRTDAAIFATAKEVRIRDGKPARSEFSSSTGGYTAGGVFPAVPDEGDDVAQNPNHNWTTRVGADAIEARYQKGQLQSVDVLARNGLGADGGRVTSMRLRFTGGDVNLTGNDFRRDFSLKSDWFTVANMGPPDVGNQPVGGYILRADGTLQRFGVTPTYDRLPIPDGSAQAIDLAGGNGRSGYALDGRGQIYRVGAAPAVADGGPRWAFDIARDLVVKPGGGSGYLLDGFGAVHGFGGAAKPSSQEPGSWVNGSDTARHLLLRSNGTSGYLVKTDGQVFAWGGAPPVADTAIGSGRTAVGALLHPKDDRGWVIDDAGKAHPFSAGRMPRVHPNVGGAAAAVDQRLDGRSGYVVTEGATVRAFGGARDAAAGTVATSLEVRDIAVVPEPAGYVLDGFGGLHRFGGAPKVTSQGYWPSGDVAHKVVSFPGGGGWVVDRWGQVYPFHTEAGAPPPAPWSGRRLPRPLARDIALIPGTDAGYLLDGWGGLHPFNGAPAAHGGPYWPGWDIAPSFGIEPDGTGGYVLDAWGAVHPFGIGSHPRPPASTASAYWPGWKIVRAVAVTGEGRGFTFDGWGGAHPFGGTSGRGSWYWAGNDMIVAAAHDGYARPWAVYLDAFGGLHVARHDQPAVVASRTWPNWRIARDVTLVPRP